MDLEFFGQRGTPLDRQRFTWRDLVQAPCAKRGDDAFTRVRVVHTNGIAPDPVRFRHLAQRFADGIRLPLADMRRIEHPPQSMVNGSLVKCRAADGAKTSHPVADVQHAHDEAPERCAPIVDAPEAPLAAESVDNARRMPFIPLADEAGQDRRVTRFRAPLDEDAAHVVKVRGRPTRGIPGEAT